MDTASLIIAAVGLPLALISAVFAVRATRGNKIAESQQSFRESRVTLWEQRPALNAVAYKLHSSGPMRHDFIPDTRLLKAVTHLDWLVPLTNVRVLYTRATSGSFLDKRIKRDVLPLNSAGLKYPTYAAAMEDLARPSLFFDGRIYRLEDVNQADLECPILMFSDGTYFQTIHWAESVCHELAALPKDLRSRDPKDLVKLLPIRSAVSSHLFDTQSRVLSLAINTITLIRRAGGELEFIMHKRDNRATATFAGHYMVSPIGIFQPATQSPYSAVRDCNLWLNIMREFSEEILGHPEADGSSGVTINYEFDSPYVQLERARQNGQLRIHYMGLGMDPLELSPQMLTALVIDQSVFDDAGWSVVEQNAEGLLVGHSRSVTGLQFTPFEEQQISDLVALGSLSAASQACITLAWRHREGLLAPTIGDFL